MATIQGFQALNDAAKAAGTAPQQATGAMPTVNLSTRSLTPGQNAPTPAQVHQAGQNMPTSVNTPTTYQTINGPVSATPLELGQKSGMTDEQYNALQGSKPVSQAPIPGDPTTPGLNEAKSAGFDSVAAYRNAQLQAATKVVGKDAKGGDIREADPVAQEQMKTEWAKQDALAQGAQTPAAGGTTSAPGQPAAPTVPAPAPSTPLDSLKGLATSPQAQAVLQNAQQTQTASDALAKQGTVNAQNELDTTNAAYNKAGSNLESMKATLEKSSNDMKDLIAQVHAENQAAMAQQQQAEQYNLAWQAAKESRSISQQETKAHQVLVAQIALEGGFGQDAALVKVAESDANFEAKIMDVQDKLGVDQTNLAAKYSGLYIQENNDYLTKSIQNGQDLQSKLQTIGQEENTNEIAQTTATNGILKNWWTEQQAITQKNADRKDALTKELNGMTDAKVKADALAKYQQDTLDVKRAAVDAATQNKKDAAQSRMDAAGIKQDDADRTFALKLADETQKQLERKGGAVDVFSSSKNIAQAFNTGYQQIQDAKTEPDAGKAQALRATADAELKVQFSHFMNPGSIRLQDLGGTLTQQNQALWAKWGANISSALSGGGGLDDNTRDAMKNIVDNHLGELQDNAVNASITAMSKVNAFNSTVANKAIQIFPSEIISDPDVLSAITAKSGIPVPSANSSAPLSPDEWWNGKGNSQGGSFSPSGQMRTDRNNNPTAMTTDVAKTAGLQEGVDYVQGDAFPDNSHLFTAKLLGDPVETTIKAIDNAGFTTKSGQDRWTYTKDLGLSNAKWSGMSHDEKVTAIKKMYQQEGGNGSLFASTNGAVAPDTIDGSPLLAMAMADEPTDTTQ